MQRFVAFFGHWLHTLAFAAWFGGMLAVGALVAPTAFAVNRSYAAEMLEIVFRHLNMLSFVCGAIMLGATWAEWEVQRAPGALWARRLLFIRAALTTAALALALYLGVRLLPILVHLRSLGQMGDFDRLHRVYEEIAQVQFWLLAAVAAITASLSIPWRSSTGQPARSSDPPKPDHARTPEHLNTGAPRP